MNSRILLFMLLGMVIAIFVRVAWPGGRWSLGYQIQLAIVGLAAVFASVFDNLPTLSYLVWILFGMVVLIPLLLSSQANRLLLTGRAGEAARRWKWLSVFVWGKMGERYGEYGDVFSSAHTTPIETLDRKFDEILAKPQPLQAKGSLLSFKFLVYTMRGEWQRGVAFFEGIGKWSSSEMSIGPRLQAARAYAELGNLPEAFGQLNRVLAEPQSFRYRDAVFLTEAPIFSLAGDLDRLKTLLRQHRQLVRHLPKAFAPYWLGRCHMARGDREKAALAFHEARALVPAHHSRWKTAVEGKLAKLEATAELPHHPFATTEAYARAASQLDHTRESNRQIQTLLDLTHPAPVMLVLMMLLCAVHGVVLWAVKQYWGGDIERFFEVAANVSFKGEYEFHWWRLLAAMFLHGGWLHLALNSVSLLAFGTAVERLWGRWRVILIFLAAGLAGNLLSALFANDPRMKAIGASGGAFGLLAVYWLTLVWAPLPQTRKFKVRLVLLLSVIILVDLTLGLLSESEELAKLFLEPGTSIDNWAHFGGLACGLVLGYFLRPASKSEKTVAT